MHRRTLLASAGALAATAHFSAAKANTPGVTAAEIKVGNTMPYSGPLSAKGVIDPVLIGFNYAA
jgi:branched-chain amino acid transport system substrate-binding protein